MLPPLRAPAVRAATLRSLRPPTRRSFTTTNPILSPPSPSTSPFVARARARARTAHTTRTATTAQYKRRMLLSATGMLLCALGMYGVITRAGDATGTGEALRPMSVEEARRAAAQREAREVEGVARGLMCWESGTGESKGGNVRMDGPAGFGGEMEEGGKVVRDGVEMVGTGNKTVPYFPRTLKLPKALGEGREREAEELHLEQGKTLPLNDATVETEDYILLGTGHRSVSFLGISVYVVGMYVAAPDLPALHARLLATAVSPPDPAHNAPVIDDTTAANAKAAPGPVVTSLVPSERQALRDLLLDPDRGVPVWDKLLREANVKSLFRIVPTRGTDMSHLRDSWVRSVQSKAQAAAAASKQSDSESNEYADPALQTSIADLKAAAGTGKRHVPKGACVFMLRGRTGEMHLLTQPAGKMRAGVTWLGAVGDERVSRVLWSKYLAGRVVASEEARRNVVAGLMELVERPKGAVEGRVV